MFSWGLRHGFFEKTLLTFGLGVKLWEKVVSADAHLYETFFLQWFYSSKAR